MSFEYIETNSRIDESIRIHVTDSICQSNTSNLQLMFVHKTLFVAEVRLLNKRI